MIGGDQEFVCTVDKFSMHGGKNLLGQGDTKAFESEKLCMVSVFI